MRSIYHHGLRCMTRCVVEPFGDDVGQRALLKDFLMNNKDDHVMLEFGFGPGFDIIIMVGMLSGLSEEEDHNLFALGKFKMFKMETGYAKLVGTMGGANKILVASNTGDPITLKMWAGNDLEAELDSPRWDLQEDSVIDVMFPVL